MNISEIQLVKHTKLEFDTYTTHVFSFAQPVDIDLIMDHAAISAFLQNRDPKSYEITKSDCNKVIRIRITNTPTNNYTF